jgi:hypothetical protein
MVEKRTPVKKVTLALSEDDKQRLEVLARQLGYLQTRGAGVRQVGSISMLLRAIAQGQIVLARAPETKEAHHTDHQE